MKNEAMMTIMCGLPRSGKSSWVERNRANAVVINPDTIRSMIFGHQFHAYAEDHVWALAKSMVRILLPQGKSVIIDATNTTYSRRKIWEDIAEENEAIVQIVWFRTSLAVCQARSAASEDGQVVPDDVIYRMANFFENPLLSEGKTVQVPIENWVELGDDLTYENYYDKEVSAYIPENKPSKWL